MLTSIHISEQPIWRWLLIPIAAIVLRALYNLLNSSPLSVPGPFLARFSRLWYFTKVSQGQFNSYSRELHSKYGPVIRLAPSWFLINDPSALKKIYGFSAKFNKSKWYEGWSAPHQPSLFNERDPKAHSERRRQMQNLYTTTSLSGYEQLADDCADILVKNLPRDEAIDFGVWLQWYAFDVIAQITYGQRIGFLEQRQDINNTTAQIDGLMGYSTLVGIYSELHPWLWPLANLFGMAGARGRKFVIDFVLGRISDRSQARAQGEKKHTVGTNGRLDFLDRIIDAHDEDPVKMPMGAAINVGTSNIIAGSDTTAGSLAGVIYEVVKNKKVLEKLRDEVKDHHKNGRIVFRDAFELPYLTACIKEGMRLHPVVGLPLWRDVPAGGVELAGQFFPAGSTVGVQADVMHTHKDVFGPDPKVFRPERWLATDPEQLKLMEATWMGFGLGSRVCIGRHISELEMWKILPRLLLEFDIELEDKDQKYHTVDYWFVKPEGFRVRIKDRAASAA